MQGKGKWEIFLFVFPPLREFGRAAALRFVQSAWISCSVMLQVSQSFA
jgi:hypothetical protein